MVLLQQLDGFQKTLRNQYENGIKMELLSTLFIKATAEVKGILLLDGH